MINGKHLHYQHSKFVGHVRHAGSGRTQLGLHYGITLDARSAPSKRNWLGSEKRQEVQLHKYQKPRKPFRSSKEPKLKIEHDPATE